MSTYKALLNHTNDLYNNNLIDKTIYEKMKHQLQVLKEKDDSDKRMGIIYRTSYELRDKATKGISQIPKIDNYTDFFKVLASTDKLGMSKDFELICIKSVQKGNKTEILSKETVPLESLRLNNQNLELTSLRTNVKDEKSEIEIDNEYEESMDDYALEM